MTWYEHINSLPDDLVAVIFGASKLLQDAGVFYNLLPMRQPNFYAAVFGIIRDTE
jgi:vancomycin permeability regulator SanA